MAGSRVELGVRRGKAAFFSGCKAHPAIAPAGSNQSRHGGKEMAEASGVEGQSNLTEKRSWGSDHSELCRVLRMSP